MAIRTGNNGRPLEFEKYEWKTGTATVAGSTPNTNLNTISGFSSPKLFSTVTEAELISITAAGGTAYVCLNSTSNDVIQVTATTPITNRPCRVDSIFIATGGAAVTITVSLQ